MKMRSTIAAVGLIGALGFASAPLAADYGKDRGKQAGPMEHDQSYGKQAKAGSWILDSDRIEGMTVKSRDGKEVGTISDVMLDTKSGRVAFVVVSSGGVLGVGDRKYVVPWEALSVRQSGDYWEGYFAKMDAEKLKNAPEYTDDMISQGYDQRSIYNFYGLAPWGKDTPG
jgi:sporulation protein YlmC with PRC-barrel domain